MKCIFCKSDSSSSRSIEHIIPESLGNKEHILPPGVVCDECNNYFSRKIEKKLLEQSYFSSLRFRNLIKSKKGRYPREKGVLMSPLTLIELERGTNGDISLNIDNKNVLDKLITKKKGTLIMPAIDMPEQDNQIISRFIGKVGIEALASILMETEEGLEEIVEKKELDGLRRYVRYGNPNFIWPYHMRRLDSDGKVLSSEGGEKYEILHEYRLLYTDKLELFIIIAIMGIEYCLNMGEPNLYSYREWLKKNNDKSPLDNDLCKIINMSTVKY